MATASKTPRQRTRTALQASGAPTQGMGTTMASQVAQDWTPGFPPGVRPERPLDPEQLPHRAATLDDGYSPPDHRSPFLTAAQSHLDVPANPKPEWPHVQGLFGTGAISVLARLDEAMERRSRSAAEAVETMRLPAEVAAYKASVLEWLGKEGL
jgi:hypothetical protein